MSEVKQCRRCGHIVQKGEDWVIDFDMPDAQGEWREYIICSVCNAEFERETA